MKYKNRLLILFLLPFIATFYLSNKLQITFDFNPLVENEVKVPIVSRVDLDSIENILGLDTNILKYKTLLFHNLKTTIGGDEKDYEHEVEIFMKINENSEEEYKLKRGKTEIVFFGLSRSDTILKIQNLFYRPNINLKPEVLTDSNKLITLNKGFSGAIFLKSKLTFLSKCILFFVILVVWSGIIVLFKEMFQFVVCDKKYL